MSRPRVWLVVLVGVSLLAAACRSTPPETAASQPPDDAEAASPGTPDPGTPDTGNPGPDGFNDPSADGERGPNEPRQVPPLNLPSAAPGSDEAAEELIASLDRFITDEQRAAGVPWPDLRNPDPIESYRSDATFQQWMSENNPTPILVEAYTAPNSPERGFDLEMFDQLNRLDLRSGPSTPPYSMRVEELVHPAATAINDTLLAQVPEGSAAIIYWDSVGASDMFTSDGRYWGTQQGWTDVGPWVAIMAPTDVGWQVWWDELTEPPPPGSRQQGVPQPDVPRRDV